MFKWKHFYILKAKNRQAQKLYRKLKRTYLLSRSLMFPLLGEGPTHTRKRKKIKQSSFLFFLFIILPILETFLFVSGRFATVYFAACQNLKQSRTVSCVLLTEKGARSCTVHFPSNLLQIRIKHLKCKEISIAYLVYTSRLFNREGINFLFRAPPPPPHQSDI